MITTIIRMSKFFVTEHKVRENGEKSSPGSTLHFIMGNKKTILFIWLWFFSVLRQDGKEQWNHHCRNGSMNRSMESSMDQWNLEGLMESTMEQ